MSKTLSLSLACAAFTLISSLSLRAQVQAYDDATGYTNGNPGWMYLGTTNGGFGFTPWVYAKSGVNYQGFFLNKSGTTIATGGNVWAMYGNGPTPTNIAVAYRGFSNAVPANGVFRVRWQTFGISASTNMAFGGFSLRTGNANASTADLATGERLAFLYRGGGGVDGASVRDSAGEYLLGYPGVPYSVLSAGATIEVILLSADTYRLVIKNVSGTTTVATYEGMLAGAGQLQSVALYVSQTDGDQVFNNMEIATVSLIPPQIANITPTNNSVFVPTTTSVEFDVTSGFSTIPTNGISLALNGTTVSNLTFTGDPNNWHVIGVPALVDNTTYNGVVTVLDSNGNRATNTFAFNTWRGDLNPVIEAEDYNFGSGGFIPPPNSFPNTFNGYAGLLGANGVDYFEYDPAGTNNVYRAGDLPDIQQASDIDHSGYAGFGYVDYNLGWVQNGEWLNYTRAMTNVTYSVQARMAGFGANPVMLLERLASPTATAAEQPRAALGTFVCPQNTGGSQSYTFVPLKDFFSNPVEIRFAGTNTFRATCIGSDGSYNFNYLMLVPSANTNTLRPYISAGFPYPGVGGVMPDQRIHFTVANRQTAVVPGSIQLFLNSNDVTAGVVLSNTAAGTEVAYGPAALLPAGANTLTAVFGDGSATLTNTWQFTVSTLTVVPSAYAIPLSEAGVSGFALQIAKAADDSPEADFPPTVDRALRHLAGLITNQVTQLPYPNLAAGPNNDGLFNETGVINYDINATANGNCTFNYKSPFPYIAPSGTNNFISLQATMYMYLTAGVHTLVVRSDDGFRLTTGPTPVDPVTELGVADYGRGNDTPTTFSFIIQTNGLYPMRLIYDQGVFGGNIEFYSIQNGTPVLVNNLTNASALQVYRTVTTAQPVMITNAGRSGGVTGFSFLTQAGKTHTVEYKNTLTDALWQTLTVVAGNGVVTNISDATADLSRFYRVKTQ